MKRVRLRMVGQELGYVSLERFVQSSASWVLVSFSDRGGFELISDVSFGQLQVYYMDHQLRGYSQSEIG